jgi:hypothetical protein
MVQPHSEPPHRTTERVSKRDATYVLYVGKDAGVIPVTNPRLPKLVGQYLFVSWRSTMPGWEK